MPHCPLSLEMLLAPVTVENFLSTYYQRKPLVVQNRDAEYYREFMSLDDLDFVVGLGHKGYPSIGLQDKDREGTIEYDARGSVDARALRLSFGRGMSVHVKNLDRRCPQAVELRRQLQTDFAALGLPLTPDGVTIAFLTPSHSCALPPHLDPEDLFVLQLDGCKQWRFFGAEPQHEFNSNWESDLPAVSLETTVCPGDLLYIPRGFLHQAETGDEHSLAVTFGYRAVWWADVIENLIRKCLRRIEPARETISPGYWQDGRLTEEGVQHLHALMRQLPDEAIWRDAAQEFRCEPPRSSDCWTSALRTANRARNLTLATVLRRVAAASVSVDGDRATISFADDGVSGPQSIEVALRWIAEREGEFPLGEVPPCPGDKSKIVLCKRLVLSGLLKIVESPA